ncbi:MAG: hypothetical protein ACLP52_08595 [Streptosporangiaceae bacterium]
MSPKHSTIGAISWYMAALIVIAALAVADDLIRHGVLVVAVALAAPAAFYVGRRSRQAADRRAATRRLQDSQREQLIAELETLAHRSLEEITASYRVIARRHGGQP